jgi:ABC-type enterochelin transport system substrate-binding protein
VVVVLVALILVVLVVLAEEVLAHQEAAQPAVQATPHQQHHHKVTPVAQEVALATNMEQVVVAALPLLALMDQRQLAETVEQVLYQPFLEHLLPMPAAAAVVQFLQHHLHLVVPVVVAEA